MFKLSIAFSVTTLAGAATVSNYCNALTAQCSVHALNATNCVTAMTPTPEGTDFDENVNTLGCRYKYLTNASFSYDKCRFAGPSGGGRCGPVVKNVCDIATSAGVCGAAANPSYADSGACVIGLDALKFVWGAKQGQAADAENSLECRIYHALASVGGAAIHCTHFNATGGPCIGAVSTNATQYCDVVEDACGSGSTGANAQYGSKTECQVVAAGFTPGATGVAPGDNTLGCRTYHAHAAKLDSARTHCAHAGPTGGTQCGSSGQAWGSILAAAPCSDPHVSAFVASIDNSTLLNTLVPSGVITGYNTSSDTSGNTQACRIYHLGVAANATSHCSHGYLSGGATCGNYIDNFCTFVQGACGFGANATWQFASAADCKAQMASLTPGITKPQDVANNTYECRFYHASVAASFAPGATKAGEAGAAVSRVTHCSHVLKVAAVNGCGYIAPTKAPTAAGQKSSASGLSVLASLLVVGASALSL